MTDNIRRRLEELERRCKEKAPLSFLEFAALWQQLTPFDRAAFEADALREENTVLRGYLVKLGVMDGSEKTLQQIAAELDAEGA